MFKECYTEISYYFGIGPIEEIVWKLEMSAPSAHRDLGCWRVWNDASRTSGQTESRCVVGDVAPASAICMLAFVLEADISSIWCKDDVTY